MALRRREVLNSQKNLLRSGGIVFCGWDRSARSPKKKTSEGSIAHRRT